MTGGIRNGLAAVCIWIFYDWVGSVQNHEGRSGTTRYARIIERGITLIHPYCRNKSGYTDFIYFSCKQTSISKGSNGEMKHYFTFQDLS